MHYQWRNAFLITRSSAIADAVTRRIAAMVSCPIGVRISTALNRRKIVPSGHGAEHSPQGIAEVLRILHEHIASRGSGKQPRPGLRRTELPAQLKGNGL